MHPIRRKCSAIATASAAPSSGIGGRAQFIQQHQRVRRRGARDEIDVGDVGGESRKILLDGLIVADIGQHRIKHRQLGAIRGDGNAGLRHQGQQPNRFQAPPFFRRCSGPVMTSSRRSPSSSMLMGTTCPPLAFRFRSSSGCRALRRTSRARLGSASRAEALLHLLPTALSLTWPARSCSLRQSAPWQIAAPVQPARPLPSRSSSELSPIRRVISSRMR